MIIRFIEKGWLGLCPVYMGAGEVDFEVTPRHWLFEPLFLISLAVFMVVGFFLPNLNLGVYVTGKLPKPIEMEVGDAD
jgi:hypothetical protein